MAEVTVDATTIPCRVFRRRKVEIAVVARAWDDTLVSSRPTLAADVPEWDVETGILSEAAAVALLADLRAAGTISLGGDQVGSTVTCGASNIGWRPVGALSRRRVTFMAKQVTP